MKSSDEWRKQYSGEKLNQISSWLRWSDGSLIEAIQLDALKQGMQDAADIVLSYAKEMRGAHVNTNNSSAAIKRLIIIALDSKV